MDANRSFALDRALSLTQAITSTLAFDVADVFLEFLDAAGDRSAAWAALGHACCEKIRNTAAIETVATAREIVIVARACLDFLSPAPARSVPTSRSRPSGACSSSRSPAKSVQAAPSAPRSPP